MTYTDIKQQRLHNQKISTPSFANPAEVVSWMGAMQAQDYAGAKWAIGLRCKQITDTAIETAINDGRILRTHIMRPTWHFVTPKNIRWMLELTSPRVHAANAHYHRKLGLDEAVFKKSTKAIITALVGGKQMTRSELVEVLKRVHVPTEGLRHLFLIMHAELEGIICSGPRRGKQFTYMLLDERVPHTHKIGREEALQELTKRYFISHGPATIKDYIWWSGLSMSDAKKGLELTGNLLRHTIIDDKTYWFSQESNIIKKEKETAHLLPNYDEYIVGYTDRSAIIDKAYISKLDARANPLFQNTIVLNGNIVGTWKRESKKDTYTIQTKLFTKVTEREENNITEEIQAYGKFLETSIE